VSVAQRVGALAERYRLAPGAGERLATLLDVLAEDPLAPSSVTDRERAVDVHLADSLSALALPAVAAAQRIADIGAGAGFPGLVLAVALPHAEVALVESVRRKCEFLERATAAVGATNAIVVGMRAEAWAGGHEQQDLVVARAVGPLALLCEYAAPLLCVGGTLVAWKGRVSAAETAAGDRAADLVGLEPAGVIRTAPYARSVDHRLCTYVKTSDTPTRFPRRPGAGAKHPLGSSD
jgi:16S rRNA (guanine527-N7)-methyltransferase